MPPGEHPCLDEVLLHPVDGLWIILGCYIIEFSIHFITIMMLFTRPLKFKEIAQAFVLPVGASLLNSQGLDETSCYKSTLA